MRKLVHRPMPSQNFGAMALALGTAMWTPFVVQAEPATPITAEASRAVLDRPPFADRKDFAKAARGLLRKPDTLTILGADGKPVWDLESYKAFITQDAHAPDSVNPSLWRNAQPLLN